MTYTKTTFVNGQVPAVSAEELNKITTALDEVYNTTLAYSYDTPKVSLPLANMPMSQQIVENGNWGTVLNIERIKSKEIERMSINFRVAFYDGESGEGSTQYTNEVRMYLNGVLKYVGAPENAPIIDISGVPNGDTFAILITAKNISTDPSIKYGYINSPIESTKKEFAIMDNETFYVKVPN